MLECEFVWFISKLRHLWDLLNEKISIWAHKILSGSCLQSDSSCVVASRAVRDWRSAKVCAPAVTEVTVLSDQQISSAKPYAAVATVFHISCCCFVSLHNFYS